MYHCQQSDGVHSAVVAAAVIGAKHLSDIGSMLEIYISLPTVM